MSLAGIPDNISWYIVMIDIFRVSHETNDFIIEYWHALYNEKKRKGFPAIIKYFSIFPELVFVILAMAE